MRSSVILVIYLIDEQANALHNFNARPHNDPYSTTYNPAWRYHPNSYKTPNSSPPSFPKSSNAPNFQYRAPPQYQAPPPPPQKPNFENLMERFIQTQIKTNEAVVESVSQQLNTKLESLSTHQKMMVTQLMQIAQQVSHFSRP